MRIVHNTEYRTLSTTHFKYRSGTVNSKSFVGKVLLRIKWKFKLTVYFKHGILGNNRKIFHSNFELSGTSN